MTWKNNAFENCVVKGKLSFMSVSDNNECGSGAHNCHATRATCTNTNGAYTCACNTGYSGDGIQCEGNNISMFFVCLYLHCPLLLFVLRLILFLYAKIGKS